MRASTLNKTLENHKEKRTYISVNGKLYELGKIFVYDDQLDEEGKLKNPGRVVLYAGNPLVPEIKDSPVTTEQ